jgi:GDP-L-fucose synthase
LTDHGTFSLPGKRIWIAGHTGMVGSALMRRLADADCELVTAGHGELDLRRQGDVEDWLAEVRPDAAVVAAATVGGILANDSRPAEFIYDNMMIAGNVIHTAHRIGMAKLLYLGSSCIYPREARQPMSEEALLTGPLEPTNQWYAMAKISGIKLCQAFRRQHGCDFIAAMPTNLFGPGDNFDLQSSHVIPALMRKAHEAKRAGAPAMSVWGSGSPMREFLYVDDLADALVFLLENYSGESHVNVGTGTDVTIRELAETVCRVVGFEGELEFDASKPDGMPRKLLDVSRLNNMGWRHTTDLETGLRKAYRWFLDNQDRARL